MARGFGNQGLPPQAQPEPGMPPEGMPAAGDDSSVSPEEQAQYEQFVDQAKILMYDERFLPTLLERLATNVDDETGFTGVQDDIAQAAVLIIQRVQEAATQAGEQVSDDVLMQAGEDVVELLGELVEAADIAEVDEETLTGAFYRALDLWRQQGEANGTIDGEALKQQFGMIQQADQEGRLGELLPGIDAAMREG